MVVVVYVGLSIQSLTTKRVCASIRDKSIALENGVRIVVVYVADYAPRSMPADHSCLRLK